MGWGFGNTRFYDVEIDGLANRDIGTSQVISSLHNRFYSIGLLRVVFRNDLNGRRAFEILVSY